MKLRDANLQVNEKKLVFFVFCLDLLRIITITSSGEALKV